MLPTARLSVQRGSGVAVSLGVANTTEADVPLLGEISRTEADIRAAIGRLENPTQRLSDRLFWFHLPLAFGDAKSPVRPSELDGAAWSHDEALRGLFHICFRLETNEQ